MINTLSDAVGPVNDRPDRAVRVPPTTMEARNCLLNEY